MMCFQDLLECYNALVTPEALLVTINAIFQSIFFPTFLYRFTHAEFVYVQVYLNLNTDIFFSACKNNIGCVAMKPE